MMLGGFIYPLTHCDCFLDFRYLYGDNSSKVNERAESIP